MGNAAIKFKLMPSSPEVDFEKIKDSIKEILKKEGIEKVNFEEEPIAFGLKALIVFFLWPEEKELEPLEGELNKLENVNSVELADMRRAFG